MSEHVFTIEFEDEKIAAVFHDAGEQRDAVALLLHGGPDGTKEGPSDLYVRLASHLADAGIASLRIDFLGEGESTGDYARTTAAHQVRQYRRAIDWITGEGYGRVGVVGESFGGTCALGGFDSATVNALVLLWPAIWLLDSAFEPFTTPEQQRRVHRDGVLDIEGKNVGAAFIDDLLAAPDREKELRAVTAPTLLIHGDADVEVPVHQSDKAYELLGEPKRLVTVQNAEHCLRRPHEQALVFEETTKWLTQFLLP